MEEQNRRVALEFLDLVIAGRFDEAYGKYVDMNGKHHNLYYPAGFPALKKGMEENHAEFPEKKLAVKHVLASDDLVAVHSHVILKPKEREVSVVHLFRMRDGRIAEMWDCGQVIPQDSPNRDGAF